MQLRSGLAIFLVLALGAGCREPNPAFEVAPEGDAAALDVGIPADARPAVDRPRDEGVPDRPPPSAERPPAGPASEAGPAIDLLAGLVGHWKLDDGAGKTVALDSSGNGNHGTLESLDAQTAWVAGKLGGAIEFPPGVRNAGIRVAPSPSIDAISRAFTVAAWAYRTSAPSGVYNAVLSRQMGSGDYDIYDLTFLGDTIAIYVAPDVNVTSGVRKTPLRQWIHVAATYDGTIVRLYLDGEQVATLRYGETLPRSANPLFVGTNKNGDNFGEPMVGRLDDVLLYARALPAAAIAALAAGASPPR